MSEEYIELQSLKFLLFGVHQTQDLLAEERFADYDKTSLDIFLDAVKTYSDNSLFPHIKEMDEKPSYFQDGKIVVHPAFESILKQAGEMGLVAAMFNYEDGGLQMPATIFHAAYFIMEAANNHVPGYLGLTAGSANLIHSFGSQDLKETYLPKMLELTWGGTMCLTEPQAGSSLSDVTSSARPTDQGYFLIKGQKIFISAGDHQFADNFVHLVLARIHGAPAGTKGVSLFVVPKNRPAGADKLEPNDVQVAGEFEKMGQKGYCTTHLVFGDHNDCRGWLIGEDNKGLSYMFQMMNEARVATGRMGAAIASAAYHSSLQYAKERPQGRKLNKTGQKNVEEAQTLIINHPDVKRMLLKQKAIVEGSLSLIIETAKYLDKEMCSKDKEEKEKYNLLLELLTPVAKTFPAEKGIEATSLAVQVLGGYGFCADFMPQQYYRDIRIISIYEGTTGIQSLDLLGRKIPLKNGKALALLQEEIQKSIELASHQEDLQPYALQLTDSLVLCKNIIQNLMPFALKGNYERFLSDATVFMEFFGTLVIGWQWLKIGNTAHGLLKDSTASEKEEFYRAKINTMKFFFAYELPKTSSLAAVLLNEEELTLKESEELF